VRPGKYDLRSETTVLEAVEMAGGFTQRAKHSQVVLFRKMDADRFEAKLLDVKKMLAQRDLTENPQLQPGDLVYVPQNMFSKIAPFLSRPGVGMYMSPSQF
jgi:polysaccharide biosynthesis/export protein